MTANSPVLVGHRGAAALEPENTLRSFRRGVAEGAGLLECDVHLSADGQDVIIHDGTLDRTAEEASPLRTGAVADYTRAQLDTVLVGKGEHLPTLAQVLEVAVREDGSRVPVLVEIKAPDAADLVVRVLHAHYGADVFAPADGAAGSSADGEDWPALVLSFHADALRRVRELDPAIPLMLTTKETSPEWWETCRELGVAHAGVRIADARQGDVETAAALGVKLNLWTARTEEQLEHALELGCDTLTVDDPVWARDAIAQRTGARVEDS